MTWQPRDLETIATMGHARATALGITPEEFKAWVGRLVAARAAWVPPTPPQSAAKPLATPEPMWPRIEAERLFEANGQGDDPIDD